jgi:hypothetical protein
MERILNSQFCRSLSEGQAVELWEDNQVVEGWTVFALVSMQLDEVTVLAEFRVRGGEIERRVVDPGNGPTWIPLE